ncbi:MAG: hypothetical protein ACXVCY_06310 [Pseudobdellovibrionaceae bacterium]
MEMTNNQVELSKNFLESVQFILTSFGYDVVKTPYEDWNSLVIASLHSELKNSQLNLECRLTLTWQPVSKIWSFSLTLTNSGYEHCHLSLLLPKMVPPVDNSIRTCEDSEDLSKLKNNLEYLFAQKISPLLKNELKPFILGQKWLTTYIPNPRDDGY